MKRSLATLYLALLQGVDISASKWGMRYKRSPIKGVRVVRRIPQNNERLDMEHCQEPNEPGYGATYSGSFGPEKIKCCRTGREVLATLEKRCQDCNDAVPCTDDMESKWCPMYLAKYKQMRDDVCRAEETTTTTTTTTTTATTTKTTKTTTATGTNDNDAEKVAKKPAEDAEKAAKKPAKIASKPQPTAEEKHRLNWCFKLCTDMAQTKECKDEERCEKFCKEAESRFAEMREV